MVRPSQLFPTWMGYISSFFGLASVYVPLLDRFDSPPEGRHICTFLPPVL